MTIHYLLVKISLYSSIILSSFQIYVSVPVSVSGYIFCTNVFIKKPDKMKKANVGMTVCRANGVWVKTWWEFEKNVWPPWMLCRGCWRRVMVTRLESVNVPCAVLGASYFLLSLVSVFTPDLWSCVGCGVSHMGIHTAIHYIVNHASLGSHFQSIQL